MRNSGFHKKLTFLIFIACCVVSSSFTQYKTDLPKISISEDCSVYDELQLEHLGLKRDVFEKAVKGWKTLKSRAVANSNLLSIVDLSQSSNSKRLYVIDLEKKKVLFNTYVAHGRNSGQEYASSFSNSLNSFKSSLGFYITENTYTGAHGLSMRLRGVEQGINDIALERGIVMHGAPYVSESFIRQYGRLGRSQGCPAVAEELCEPIIHSIMGGSCFFMFYPDSNYIRNSNFL
jgi:hypothetical protein